MSRSSLALIDRGSDESSSGVPQEGWDREVSCPSQPMRRLVSEIRRVAKFDVSVVILGETGSGKEVVARAVHQASSCCRGPFVAVDCGAIPDTLMEGELFGHEKGAFTGANARQAGKIEAARGGTLFLDEIANLPLGSQATLLRALQEKTIFRIGAAIPTRIEARLLVASNENLPKLVEGGRFRRDLYFRLNEFTLLVPPLRDREEDILYLAQRFLHIISTEIDREALGFSEQAVEAMLAYSWPGNVRELRSCIRRAVLLADDHVITREDLGLTGPQPLVKDDPPPPMPDESNELLPLKELVRRQVVKVEREAILRMLQRTGGNKAKAARLLQIDYKTMHSKVREYGITIE